MLQGHKTRRSQNMKRDYASVRAISLACAGLAVCLWHPARATAQPPSPASQHKPAGTTAAGQQSFPSAEAAAQALLAAAQANDVPALTRLFGPAGKEIITSGDPVQDRNRRAAFVDLAKHRMKLQPDPANPSMVVILIGLDDFPFPAPLVKTAGGAWRFDTQKGKREMLARRIGSNELDAIDLCATYVEAQRAFAAGDPEHSGVHQYAQRLISSPGKKDGLYWPQAGKRPSSPIGELVTQAALEGYDTSGLQPVPYHGYFFRILTGQGPRARGGAQDYLVHGLMIGGFGLVAWPAEYRASGVKTFLVNQEGVVYEKDLGPSTPAVARAIKTFNPDSSWKEVK